MSSLLDLENGYALKELAEESSKDNDAMRMLTEKATQDAAAVKVLTVITLIYLPASAVSVGLSCLCQSLLTRLELLLDTIDTVRRLARPGCLLSRISTELVAVLGNSSSFDWCYSIHMVDMGTASKRCSKNMEEENTRSCK